MITNKQVVEQINKKILKKPLFYVTQNKEKGLGLGNLLTNFKIIATTWPKDIAKILETMSFPSSFIIVFKNNARIQRFWKQRKLKLLNPDCYLVEKYENKISQYQWLKKIIPANLPKTIITTLNKISFKNLSKKLRSPFIVQFNHSHTGEGTLLISQIKQWQELVKKFPKREIKCVQFIDSPTITVNVCAWGKCVLMGNLSYQITGIKKLTDFPFSTVGNDWSLAGKIFKQEDIKKIKFLCQKIGQAMIKDGWKGLFGLDLIKRKKWLVIEINARQPASTGMETFLQRKTEKGITIFAAHIAALLKLPLPGTCKQVENSLQKITKGSRIIIRNKKFGSRASKLLKHNAELFTIQNFKTGFITKSGRLNVLAKQKLKIFK